MYKEIQAKWSKSLNYLFIILCVKSKSQSQYEVKLWNKYSQNMKKSFHNLALVSALQHYHILNQHSISNDQTMHDSLNSSRPEQFLKKVI